MNKLSRWLPLVVALLVSAGLVLAQQGTAFFGDILVLYRQDAGAFPAATNYRGAVVYDTGSNTPWYSNGTTWQPIDTAGGGGGETYWVDAGAGTNAFVNSPTSAQMRVGTRAPNAFSGYEPVSGLLGTSSAVVYSDGGLALNALVDRGGRVVGSLNAIPNSGTWFGANFNVLTDRNTANVDYAQIYLAARGSGTVTSDDFAAVTYFDDPGSNYQGLWLSSGRNIVLTPNVTTSLPTNPTFRLDTADRLSLASAPVTTARLTVSALPVNGQAIATTGVTSTTNAIAIETATNIDFGTGTNDFLTSNGTRLRVGNIGVTLGGLDAVTFRVVGNADSASMVTSAVSGNGGIGFRQSDNQLYTMSTGKDARPLLSGPDWAYDGRAWNVDVPLESTACPVIRNTLEQTSGGAVTATCHDDAAGGTVVSSGFPVRGYRTFNTTTTAGNRSGFMTGTMPASSTPGTPQVFIQRRAGFVAKMWVRSSSIVTNVRWYAGLVSAIPAVGTPVPNAAAYIRYDTSAGDTRFNFCTVSASTATCIPSASLGLLANTDYLFVIDCRELNTSCRVYINGASEMLSTSNLPGLTANMGFVFAVENTASLANSISLGRVSILTE